MSSESGDEEKLARWRKWSRSSSRPFASSPTTVRTSTSCRQVMSCEELTQLYSAGLQLQLSRALPRKQHSLLKHLCKAKKEAPPTEKPEVVKMHLKDRIILPEMMGIYKGKTLSQVEIKPEMIGHYLGEFSIMYKTVKHSRPGIGAAHSSRFIPLTQPTQQ